ncbi:hypothetical protein GCM10029992_08840 [Glycomyces albus]
MTCGSSLYVGNPTPVDPACEGRDALVAFRPGWHGLDTFGNAPYAPHPAGGTSMGDIIYDTSFYNTLEAAVNDFRKA